ncbi:hypothetical protein, partial [Lactiplantibacillus plantarum]|uniref:hypothetical protein n=1 Tax=Lactiplantibacillus plantarum TaxID=1590 RepID=UPI003854291C
DRHPDLFYLDPQRSVPAAHHLADGIVEMSNPLQTDSHPFDPLRGKGQTVEESFVHPSIATAIDVSTVGSKDLVDAFA